MIPTLGLLTLLWSASSLAADPDTLRPALAIKIKPVSLPRRAAASLGASSSLGAQLVRDLVRQAQAQGSSSHTSHTKRETENNFQVLPLITSISPTQLAEMVQTATERDPTYMPTDFGSWFQVIFSSSSSFQSNITSSSSLMKSLSTFPDILSIQSMSQNTRLPTTATVKATPKVERAITPLTPLKNPRFPQQGYLLPAPLGISATYAWNFPGGAGSGASLIDVERGWLLSHEDLVGAKIPLLAGENVNDRWGANLPHGTAALGEIFMVDNSRGGVGIATQAKGSVVGVGRTVGGGPMENQAEAILDALKFAAPGDVILLEMQAGDLNGNLWPVEVQDAEFEAIRLATALGVVVVEPAANGGADGKGVDLDGPVTRQEGEAGRTFLKKGTKDYRDSGAIIVGAASSTVPHQKMVWSNYGSRVDVFAWGENILTTSVHVGENYAQVYESFDGTSGAAPIIAGVALSVQGMVNANRGRKFSPKELRDVIKKGGTPTANRGDKIGVQPDLKVIIDGGYLK